MALLKTDEKDFVKDTSSGAVINTNTVAYKAYIKQRNQMISNAQRDAEISALKSDMAEIKQLLQQVISKK